MSRVLTLEKELDSKIQEGTSLVRATGELLEADGRDMTAEERAAIDKNMGEVQSLRARIDRAKGDEDLVQQLESMSTGRMKGGTGNGIVVPGALSLAGGRTLSLGQQFTRSPAYEFIKTGRHHTQSQWSTGGVELVMTDATAWPPELRSTVVTTQPGSAGPLVIPQYLPGVLPQLFRRVVVPELFSQGTTTSNALVYMQELPWINVAAKVAEGTDKPEATLQFQAVTEFVRKDAIWIPVSEEALEDIPYLESYIDARLRAALEMEEEDQVLNGTGVAPNLLGILNRLGLTAAMARVDPETNADVILKQVMAIFANSFLMPDAIVMNPKDWTDCVLSKTTTGAYINCCPGGGPFNNLPNTALWGIRVVLTPMMPAGTALIGAFKEGGQLFRHGGLRVEATNSHADFFVKNLVAIRAEERIALCIYRPSAFGKVTNLNQAAAAPPVG